MRMQVRAGTTLAALLTRFELKIDSSVFANLKFRYRIAVLEVRKKKTNSGRPYRYGEQHS